MKVAVLVENKYQVLEVWYPYLRLREVEIEINVLNRSGRVSWIYMHGFSLNL